MYEEMRSICEAGGLPDGQSRFAAWEERSSEAAKQKPRVLVVDDEKLIADTMTDILEGAGFDVATAYDGWGALAAADRVRPDYLLSDVSMPQMNGVELAIALRQMHPGITILLISGQAGISDLLHDAENRGHRFDCRETNSSSQADSPVEEPQRLNRRHSRPTQVTVPREEPTTKLGVSSTTIARTSRGVPSAGVVSLIGS